MDIVQFFLSYVFLFGLMLVTVLLTHISPAFGRFVNATKIATLKVITAATPDLLCKVVNKSFYYVFYTRNPLLQVLNVFLMLLGNMVYLLEVIPVLYTFKKEKHQILLTPFILLALTLVPFYLSCVSDPGKIVSTSKAACLALVYKPDGVMFSEGNYCRTCKQVKPARSKHCNLCGHCVHRFDHHCLWTNNCVGAGNLRYFLLFLVCLQIMVGHGALRGLEALGLVVRHSGLLGTRLFGDVTNGKRTVDDLYFLLENLFLHQPGCVLLVTSLILLFVLIGLLLSYHVMLVLYNQTTNERYKISSLSQQQQQPPCCETFDERKQHDQIQKYPNLTNTQLKTRMIKTTSDKISHWCCSDQTHQRKGERLYYNNNVNDNNNKNNNDNNACFTREGQNLNFDYLNTFYNRGALKNIKEVFFPWAEYDHIIKSKAKETERWNHRSFRKS